MSLFAITLISALALDLVLGDPERMPHPIRWIGRMTAWGEGLLRNRPPDRLGPPGHERLKGAALVVMVVAAVYLVSLVLLYLAYRYSTLLFLVVAVYMVWASISIKTLAREARGVLQSLEEHGLDGTRHSMPGGEGARKRLARIVGRDTEELDTEGIFKAAAETVAENTSDGVIAPLFYLAIGGPALMLAYKAINTLDSMLGYRNERYKNFGMAAARLDDAANYIPARITAALMVAASFILRYDWRGSLAVAMRDGQNHPSPNAGVVEAAVAGALKVRFGGPMSYNGILCEKPFIGDGPKAANKATVVSSIRIMQTSALLMTAFALLIRATFLL
jgi:adenosylcobinamide-phosphate synthase